MENVVIFQNVSKIYNRDIKALNDISFSIKKGSVHAIIGPNGAGKTTILKLIAGLIFPDSGNISVKEKMAFLPEDKALYEYKSVKDMLSLAGEILPSWDRTRLKKLLDLFPQDMKKRVGELSFGNRSALYLIILFSQDLPIYLLDEPTMGLDPIITEHLLSLIKRESVNGKTIIYSSHVLSHIEEIADTVTIIKKGNILYSDELDRLKEKEGKDLKDIFLSLFKEDINGHF